MMVPGATTLTRMPRPFNSTDQPRAKERRAALLLGHVTMKTTPLTVSWMFESCVGHGFRLLGRHPHSPHTTSDDPDDQRSVCTGSISRGDLFRCYLRHKFV